jgi:hypothetical protein
MGLITRFLFIILIFFISLPLYASVDLGDPNDNRDALFDYGYGYTARETPSKTVTNGEYAGMSCTSAANAAYAVYKETRPDRKHADGQIDYIKYTWGSLIDPSECVAKAEVIRTENWPNGITRSTRTTLSLIATFSFIEEFAYSCPPDNQRQAKVLRMLGAATFCFDQVDINYRDTCPDSTQDGAYVLPVTSTNTDQMMCLDKPDGSSCKYEKVDDVYVTDFENDCYELGGLTRFDESGISQVDPTEPDCQDLGNGVSACVENPENVCDNNGLCNTGCGNVAFAGSDPVFVCLSGDSDGDGLANYIDPDVDGDGIRNEDDLDSDGDGVDDPVYQNDRNGSGTTVNVDLGNLESLTSQGNSKLSSVEALLEEQNGSGKLPEYSSIAEETTFNDSIMSRLTNAPVMVAMSSISGAINFNTEGSCPVLSFYLPVPIDKTVSTSTHCEIMPMISVIITPVMFAIYLFMGFRIFGSA